MSSDFDFDWGLCKSWFDCELKNSEFWYVCHKDEQEPRLLYHSATGILWQLRHTCKDNVHPTSGEDLVSELVSEGVEDWSIPTAIQAKLFLDASSNPLYTGRQNLCGYQNLLVKNGRMYIPTTYVGEGESAPVFACCDFFVDFPELLFKHGFENNWKLVSIQTDEEILFNIHELYKYCDYISARLPVLDNIQITDPNKGIWELHPENPFEAQHIRARNPVQDIKDSCVAIDFGTSSTVVAYEEHGQGKLLRIGVKNFWEKELPEHYENPTVLEFVDYLEMLEEWQRKAYRPLVSWDDVRCSHEALHNFRNNETNPEIVASVLTKLKQWALREIDGVKVRIADQNNSHEEVLAPLELRQPVKGQPLAVSDSDSFDPIELYAWFLGLTINWRGRGIFLKYYMAFPVAYSKEVKEKILASFRRGLQRSLPESIISEPQFQKFCVEERASEPAAYAAAALETLDIEPTDDGVAYGVFDFGGGTADFDYGYFRWPDEDEEDKGYEQVFEHFGAAGDKFLGGENLLENMAYLVFKHNLDVCRNKQIAFTKPIDASDFPGSEMFLEETQAAITNSLMVISKLRGFWESGEYENSSGIVKLTLIARDGSKQKCEFAIPVDGLSEYLQRRIEDGILNFYAALKKAFQPTIPDTIQVLLAGNSSRSELVAGFFGLCDDEEGQALATRMTEQLEQMFDGQVPTIVAHKPLEADPDNVYKPTAKTGVALGLLNLIPGSSTKVINKIAQTTAGEAPFVYYVGRIRRRKFMPLLEQGASYHQWVELGPHRERIFNLSFTQSPKASTGKMEQAENDLLSKRIELAGNIDDHRVFARAISPREIELCTAQSLQQIQLDDFDNLMSINLAS